MNRGFRILGLVALSFLVLGISSARAGMESFSATVPSTSVPFSYNFTLTGFNSSLGTLTGVTISTTTSGSASVTIINTASTAESFTNGMANFNFTVFDPAGGSFNTVAGASVASGTVQAGSPFGIATFGGLSVGGSSHENLLPADFSSFVTSGNVPLNLSVMVGGGTYGGTETTGTGNLFFGGTGSVGGMVTVTYTYTASSPNTPAVPEPSSLALCGIAGVVGLGITRLNRKRAIA